MAKVDQDLMKVNCLRNKTGKVTVDSEGIEIIWKDSTEKLLNKKIIGVKMWILTQRRVQHVP